MAQLLDTATVRALEIDGWSAITDDAIGSLRAASREVRDVDTYTSGHIVAFEGPAGSFYVVEEDIWEKQKYVRPIRDAKELDEFYAERADEYANMWGSCCGGVVKYKQRWEKWTMDKFREQCKKA